ncbi:hypothetical protein MKX03_004324 [Papaver bracteatum]|nr:hypothetical protein MKX03_004324 [Papaver bracteatum]
MEKVVDMEQQQAKEMGKFVVFDAKDIWPAQEELPAGLSRERIPKHVAFIMDGSRRWAIKRGLEPTLGHNASSHSVKLFAQLCCNWGIKVMTAEVDFLMDTFELVSLRDVEVFIRNEVRISIIGDTTKLPTGLQQALSKATEVTKNYTKLHVIVAINYGGKQDIIQACQSISRKVHDNLIKPEDINETLFNQQLDTKCTEFPYPDLLIRTSGEHRLSNFLMWQLAYTEIYFEDCLWPDFGEKEFVKALRSFQDRRRRYGGQDEDNLGVESHNQSLRLLFGAFIN